MRDSFRFRRSFDERPSRRARGRRGPVVGHRRPGGRKDCGSRAYKVLLVKKMQLATSDMHTMLKIKIS